MTLTARQLGIPAGTVAKPGHVALGKLMRIEERPTNGLGLLYRAERDGTFTRYFF